MSPPAKSGRHQGVQRRPRPASGAKAAQPRLSHLLALTATALAILLGVRLASTLNDLTVGRVREQPRGVETLREGQPVAQGMPAARLIEPAAGPDDSAEGRRSPQGDPRTVSAIEQLAAELARREEVLARREQALVVREAAMALVEQRVREQAAQLEALKNSTASLIGQVTTEDQARSARLSRIYEAMKPRNAAAIFEQTGLELLLPIVQGMREAKLSAIVAAMSPDKAKALTAELARTRGVQAAE